MKLILLLVVVLIAVFKANCRIYTGGPDEDPNPEFTDESQHLLSGSENPPTYDVDHQMKKDLNEENPIKLRGKADKNILKKLIKNLKSIEMDLQSIKENQENLKDVNTKLDSLVDVNSNQNTKLDSLVYVNSNQNTKLDSLVDVNSNQNTKLDSLVDVNLNQNTKLDSLVDVNSNQNTKLDSIIDAIGTTSPTQGTTSPTQGTTSPTQVTTTTTTPTTTVASTTRAPTTTTIPVVCVSPWVSVGEGCYLFVQSKINWTAARANCRSEGGDLPIINSEAKRIALVRYLKANFSSAGGNDWWLGGSNLSGDWLFVDNSSVTDGWNVAKNRPNSGANACMWTHMGWVGSGKYDLLFDGSCSWSLYYICNK